MSEFLLIGYIVTFCMTIFSLFTLFMTRSDYFKEDKIFLLFPILAAIPVLNILATSLIIAMIKDNDSHSISREELVNYFSSNYLTPERFYKAKYKQETITFQIETEHYKAIDKLNELQGFIEDRESELLEINQRVFKAKKKQYPAGI